MKNAIMMIDFALEAERSEGKLPAEAIYQASLRFRPILGRRWQHCWVLARIEQLVSVPSCGSRSVSRSLAA
jgi:hypothetical protein